MSLVEALDPKGWEVLGGTLTFFLKQNGDAQKDDVQLIRSIGGPCFSE